MFDIILRGKACALSSLHPFHRHTRFFFLTLFRSRRSVICKKISKPSVRLQRKAHRILQLFVSVQDTKDDTAKQIVGPGNTPDTLSIASWGGRVGNSRLRCANLLSAVHLGCAASNNEQKSLNTSSCH